MSTSTFWFPTDYTNLSERKRGSEGERESGWRKWCRCGRTQEERRYGKRPYRVRAGKITCTKPTLAATFDFSPCFAHLRVSLALECITLGFSLGYLSIPKETHRSP